MKTDNLEIVYKVKKRQMVVMEKELERILRKYGWSRRASGFDFKTQERVLAFVKEAK